MQGDNFLSDRNCSSVELKLFERRIVFFCIRVALWARFATNCSIASIAGAFKRIQDAFYDSFLRWMANLKVALARV